MPPKLSKAKEKKQAKQKVPKSIDNVDTSSLSRKELEEYCVSVYEDLMKEKQQSDVLRLERDKLADMVAIARDQLATAKNENYCKQMGLDDGEEDHRLEMQKKRGQLINLKSEKHSDYVNTVLTCVKTKEFEEQNHDERASQIITDIKDLKSQIIEAEKMFYERKTQEEINHAEQICRLRQEYNEMCILIEHTWDKRINAEVIKLNEIFNKVYEGMNSRKIKETTQLIQQNDKFIFHLNHYYKSIVHHNLNLIKQMKENLQKLKTEINTVDKKLENLRQINKDVKGSLDGTNKEIRILQEKLTDSPKVQIELKKTMMELKRKKELLEQLKLESETVNYAIEERDKNLNEISKEKHEKLFKSTVLAEEVIIVLEYMAVHLKHKLGELDSLLHELKEDLDPSEPFQPSRDCLTWELTSVVDKHDQILENYNRLLVKYDIHPDDTGFTPLLAEEILKRINYLKISVRYDEPNLI